MTWSRPALAVVLAAAVLAGASACSSQPQSVYVGSPTFAGRSTSPTGAPPSGAPTPKTPGLPGVGRFLTIRSGGLERKIRLHLPLTAPNGPRPLVIAFHDSGASAMDLARASGLDAASDRNGVIVVYPDAVGGRWSTGLPSATPRNGGVNDLAFTRDILAVIGRYARVDVKRVTVAGIGDGALMALRFASDYPRDVVGVVAIQGGLVAGTVPTVPKVPMSVTFIRGDADPSLPWVGPSATDRRGPQLGIGASVATYLALDGLSTVTPTKQVLEDSDPGDQTRVTRTQWGPSKSGRTVTLYTVKGGGSPWPGGLAQTRDFARVGRVTRDISGAAVVIRFALETRTSTP